jgi:PAS domain S-box-containing protein
MAANLDSGKKANLTLRKRLLRFIDASSLRWLLIIPFTVQTASVVTVVGYLSWRNEERTLENLIGQLLDQTESRVNQHLDRYLSVPPQLAQINADAIELGQIQPQDLSGIGRYFWKQMQVYDVSYISYVSPQGAYAAAGKFLDKQGVTIDWKSGNPREKGYTFATDAEGTPTKAIATYNNYDPLTEDWYRQAKQEKQLTWTRPYQWDATPQYISISATNPIYNSKKQLVGVVAVDLLLSNMSDFLRQLKISQSGQIFIIDREGLMVASSSQEQPFVLQQGKAQRFSIFQSKEPLVAASARYWQQKLGSLPAVSKPENAQFIWQGNQVFTHISPWRDRFGIDWLVVVVVPESDFTAQLAANRRTTILLTLVALLLAILSTLILSRWLTKPIWEFNEAAKEMAAGNLDRTVKVPRSQELRQLGTSFNYMARQLAGSFANLEKINADLEDRVRERTASLAATEAELRAILQAMTELIMVMDDRGRYLKVLANRQHLIVDEAVLIGKTLFEIFPYEQAVEFMSYINRVLTEQKPVTIEYSFRVKLQEIWFSANISPLPKQQVMIVARDVTERKMAAISLQEKNRALTQAIEQLKTTQADLVQSEKMAVLGQLIAGIAHEINTPLGAIQASISNIDYGLTQALQTLPQIVRELNLEQLSDFLALLEVAQNSPQQLSSREERQLKRKLKQQLSDRQIANVDLLAEYLSRINLTGDLERWRSLLHHPHNSQLFQTASYLVSIDTNRQNIELAVTQATQIVVALKNYARQDASGELVKASVTEGIETVLTIYRNQLKRGVKVVKNYAPVPQIPCYPEKLTQVWSNLIGNAIQAMKYTGELTIGVSLAPDNLHIVVTITDNGPGIPPELQEKIFQPFFTTKPYGEGTGLGLDIVKKIIAQHQGKIDLDSQSGKTTFTVWLPVNDISIAA